MSESARDRVMKHLIIGDCDKPFHRPECMCDDCEAWRERHGRPTFRSLWAAIAILDVGKETP